MEAGCLPDRVNLSALCRDHFSFGPSLLEPGAVFQTTDNPVGDIVTVGGVVAEARREPDVRQSFRVQLGRKEQFEARRQHAHDLWPAVSAAQHSLAENGRIPAIAPLPIIVTQDRDGRQFPNLPYNYPSSLSGASLPPCRAFVRYRRLRTAVIFREITAGHNLRAEQPEEVRRDRGDTKLLRRAVLTRHDPAARIDGGDVLKRRLRSVAQVKDICV